MDTIDRVDYQNRHVVYGAFKGFGDLLSAAPTIISELEFASTITLLIFPQLTEFSRLIDFGLYSARLDIVVLPVPLTLKAIAAFLRKVSMISPQLVWLSPHAVSSDASWKIPALVWLAKRLYWPKAIISGAASERGAWLFDRLIPIDRSLPIAIREWFGFHLAVRRMPISEIPRANFIKSIARNELAIPTYDVVLHPGASWSNKKWSIENCVDLIGALKIDYKIAVLGLKEDIEPIQRSFGEEQNVYFVAGKIELAISTIAKSCVAITMDSGAMHFANALGIPTIALFGPTRPTEILLPSGMVEAVYENKLSCQSCWKPRCIYGHAFCMDLISPTIVLAKIRRLIASTRNLEASDVSAHETRASKKSPAP